MAGSDAPADSSAAVDSSSDDVGISTPAIAAWGSGATLTDVTFDIRRVASNNTAFFKLRIALILKSSPSTKVAFYLFVHPERIRSLGLGGSEIETVSDAATALDVARNKLGTVVAYLEFVLDRPADLIGPKGMGLTPKNKVSGDVFDSLRALSRQNRFAIYFPQNVVSRAQLISLCHAACDGALKSVVRHADIASLYRGKGGQVITDPSVDSVVADDAGTISVSPPSYDEIGPGPPPAPFTAPDDVASKKRRRSSSLGSTGGRVDLRNLEMTWRKMMDEQRSELFRAMEAQQNKLYDRLLADLKPCIAQEIGQLETRILDQLEQRSAQQAEQQRQQQEDVDQNIEALREEVTQLVDDKVDEVDGRVEDEFYGLRLRLEEFIKEEVAETEARVIEHLESAATISLQFAT
jgi:hypothetical protein